MPHKRMSLPRFAAIVGLGFVIATGTQPGASLAKGDGNGNGGDHGNGGGNGNGGGGGQGAQGNQGGGGHGGNGPAGGGPSGAQGNQGGGSAGGRGAQSSGASAASTTTGTTSGQSTTAVTDLSVGQEGSAYYRMLGRAVVALNATYAVPRPPARLTRDESLRQMATYDRMMLSALQMPADTPEQQDARDHAIADARIQLAAATNRRLNTAAINRIDALLGLPSTDPRLGVR